MFWLRSGAHAPVLAENYGRDRALRAGDCKIWQ